VNLSRLILLVLVGGGALAYWKRQAILDYIADAAAAKVKSTATSYIPGVP